jgi:hypothetical protein
MGIKFNKRESAPFNKPLNNLKVGETFRFPNCRALYIASAYKDRWERTITADHYTNLETGITHEISSWNVNPVELVVIGANVGDCRGG